MSHFCVCLSVRQHKISDRLTCFLRDDVIDENEQNIALAAPKTSTKFQIWFLFGRFEFSVLVANVACTRVGGYSRSIGPQRMLLSSVKDR